MSRRLRLLMVEDAEEDALLIARALAQSGFEPVFERVDTPEALRAALLAGEWDLVTSDSRMPRFSGQDALRVLAESGRDIPFIIVSGTIGEDNAVAMMKAGANDYVLKHNLTRLGAAVERELREASSRRERRAVEENLRRQQDALQQSEKLAAMGELLAGVAHELNNPLSIVMGQAVLLRRSVAGRPEAERAEKIERAAERCVRIVRNFLALARHHPPERRSVPVRELVEGALELVAYPMRVDGVEVRREIASDLPALWADPHQLQQALINLLTNAHHAVQGSKAPRFVAVSAREDPDRGRVVIEVTDSGSGVPPEIQARIFEPFFTTKPEGEGTGLGLPLCAGIVGSHGGSLVVESPPGAGATFRIELPMEVPGGGVRESVPEAVSPIAPAAQAILVVDDEPQLAEVLAEVLQTAGYLVAAAGGGEEALEALASRGWDLVLCDLRMPGMDGPALYREAAARYPGIEQRFVFLTGDTLAADARRFLEEAGRPHLAKPFELAEIERVVARALAERPAS